MGERARWEVVRPPDWGFRLVRWVGRLLLRVWVRVVGCLLLLRAWVGCVGRQHLLLPQFVLPACLVFLTRLVFFA